MLRMIAIGGSAILLALPASSTVMLQPPAQFKANMQSRDADGSSAAGMFYFGGAKIRMELTVEGQSVIVISDPATKSQNVIMPAEKMYMQMAIGEGPVRLPRLGATDPTNPCSSGDATDCVRVGPETLNGFATVKWNYVSDGKKKTSWVATRLRFPIRTTGEDGSVTEFTNITEGAQPASLFTIPADYTKMDLGGMGMGMGMSGSRAGRAGGSRAAMAGIDMSSLPPEARAQIAAMLAGGDPTEVAKVTAPWEAGKGWVLNLTVTVSGTETGSTGDNKWSNTYSGKYTASIPLNYGTPGTGLVGAQGPMWMHMASDGMGAPEALALPLTFSAETNFHGQSDRAANCVTDFPQTSITDVKSTAQNSTPIKQMNAELMGQAMLTVAQNGKTYSIMAGVSTSKGKEETRTRTDTKSCTNAAATSESKTSTRELSLAIPVLNISDIPLPAAVGTLSGSRKLPVALSIPGIGTPAEATVAWTITQIR